MAKTLAVLVRERQGEALRVSAGLTLAGDKVEVYVLDRRLEPTPGNVTHLEMLRELEVAVRTNARENADLEYLPTDEIARRILAADRVVTY